MAFAKGDYGMGAKGSHHRPAAAATISTPPGTAAWTFSGAAMATCRITGSPKATSSCTAPPGPKSRKRWAPWRSGTRTACSPRTFTPTNTSKAMQQRGGQPLRLPLYALLGRQPGQREERPQVPCGSLPTSPWAPRASSAATPRTTSATAPLPSRRAPRTSRRSLPSPIGGISSGTTPGAACTAGKAATMTWDGDKVKPTSVSYQNWTPGFVGTRGSGFLDPKQPANQIRYQLDEWGKIAPEKRDAMQTLTLNDPTGVITENNKCRLIDPGDGQRGRDDQAPAHPHPDRKRPRVRTWTSCATRPSSTSSSASSPSPTLMRSWISGPRAAVTTGPTKSTSGGPRRASSLTAQVERPHSRAARRSCAQGQPKSTTVQVGSPTRRGRDDTYGQ